MRAPLFIYMCVAAAACASATPGNPDAKGTGGADARADAAPGTPDAPPGTPDADETPDAAPGTPDAMPDAMPDAGVITTAPDTCAQALDITAAAKVAGGTNVS